MAAILSHRCPLRVKSGHCAVSGRCPLYPQKRTWSGASPMSALCQSGHSALRQKMSLFDHLVGCGEQRRRHSHAKRLCTSALCHKRTSGLIVPGGYAGGRGSVCTAAILSHSCLLWVISGHCAVSGRCPLYPQKRTSELSRLLIVAAVA